MVLSIKDWKFDIDIIRTMEYSAAEAAEHCDCAYCRNFYGVVDTVFPQIRPFLTQFGVDVEAPDALQPYDFQRDRMWYEGEYVVFGRILQAGDDPIFSHEAGQVQIIPILEDTYPYPQPHFVLSLEGVELPWLLDEPMQEVVSPANEPQFLQKMWDKLLGKAEPNIQI